jgi:RNA polymerase sigma factor (sigma-70 family)
MQDLDDHALLRDYAERSSGAAFAEIVRRYVNQVYSTALRHTRTPHQAEEITQAVFTLLAQKAGTLRNEVILSGWLYRTARLTAVTWLRSEIRRARREQEALMSNVPEENEGKAWHQIAPLLDEALDRLGEKDRHAIVLRFFDGKSMKQVGLELGGSEDAAKMRVSRAVEKLRRYFVKRGVTLSVATIAGAVMGHSVQGAPAGLSRTVFAIGASHGAAAGNATVELTKGVLKIMAWNHAKTTLIAVAAAVFLTGTTALVNYEVTAEPSYGDKTVTQWLDQLPIIDWESFSVLSPAAITNNPAYGALMKIGPRAVPVLVERLEDRADWPTETGPRERVGQWVSWTWERMRHSWSTPRPAPERFSRWQINRKHAAGLILLTLGTNANGGFGRYAHAYAEAPKGQSVYGTPLVGIPFGLFPYVCPKAALSVRPDRRGELIAGLQQSLGDTNAWGREFAVECVQCFPEELGRWKGRLGELARDSVGTGNAPVQEAALGYMMQVAQSDLLLAIMPASEILPVAEAVLADPKASPRIRDLAATVQSLAKEKLVAEK